MSEKKEEVPQLRFPDFSENWKNKKIGKHIDIISGYAFKGEEISDNKSCRPILRGINITEGYIRHNNDIDRFYCGSLDGLEKYILEEGDLVLGMDGSKVGKNIAFITNQDEGSILIQRVARLKPKNTSSINFIYHHLHSFRFHRYVDVVNTSSGIPHISLKQIKGFQIFFPSSKEQQKIADFLSSVDQKIHQLRRKKELLEEYKKGVMQKLFPSADGQAPEIRFKGENGEDFPDWELIRGGKVFKSHSNKDHNGNLPLLAATQDQGVVTREEADIDVNVSRKSILSYKVVEPGDFVISLRSFQGGIEYSEVRGICSPAYIILKPMRKIHDDFFRYYFKKESFIERLSKTVVGIRDGKQISYTAFSGVKLKFPSFHEQSKIADFLNSIQSKIDLTSHKINKAEEFKKGLLQQMFV